MIGYLCGKFLGADEEGILVEAGGVGYSVLVSSRLASAFARGDEVELYVHTNLRENALELFGFSTLWEKKLFHALTSVSGVGPRTAMAVLGGIEPEHLLSALVREDRATLTSVSGIGKKTAERLIIELGEKARKLLAERPARDKASAAAPASDAAVAAQPAVSSTKRKSRSEIPPQGASASPNRGVDLADLWNEAIAALVNLGYREGDAVAAIRMASAKAEQAGEPASLEKLIMSSLQLMSRGLSS